MKRLENKCVLITGGTSGIGAETARLFAEEGARVVITGRSVQKGSALAKSLGNSVEFFEADVSDEAQIKSSIEYMKKKLGKIDVLFNNAGGPADAPLEQITQEDIDKGVRLLLSSVMLGTRYVIEPMKENGGGVIINNSSIAGLRYRQGGLIYSALKAAVTHFTKMSGIELGPFNIRVNSISPAAIATPIFYGGSERANTLSDEENRRKMKKLESNLAKAVPLGRSGFPRDVAEGALYLASDASQFVTSHDLIIDAGRSSMFYEPSA